MSITALVNMDAVEILDGQELSVGPPWSSTGACQTMRRPHW